VFATQRDTDLCLRPRINVEDFQQTLANLEVRSEAFTALLCNVQLKSYSSLFAGHDCPH